MPYVNAAYYPNWRAAAGQLPADVDLDVLSHVIYAFTTVQACGTVAVLTEWHRLKTTRFPHLKVLLSVGGGGGSASANFPTVAHDAKARTLFAVTARALVDRYGLDGIDIDWRCLQAKPKGTITFNYCRHLPSPYLLTSALPAGEWALQNINLVQASRHLDYINLMAYDFYGAWTEKAGNQAELYPPKGVADPSSYPSGAAAVHYAIVQGVPAHKILLGIPVYGRSFLGAKKAGDIYTAMGGDDGAVDHRDLLSMAQWRGSITAPLRHRASEGRGAGSAMTTRTLSQ